jgi:hypothetical protein
MARHGVPTSYLHSTFVFQDLVGIFDWNGKKSGILTHFLLFIKTPLLEFKVFQTMQVDWMVMFDHTTCTFQLKVKALKNIGIF